MENFGGKRVGVRFSGNGIGQVLVAVAVTLLVRVVSSPAPALSADDDCEYEPEDVIVDGGGEDAGDNAVGGGGGIRPVTIWWRNVTCSMSDKKSKSVSLVVGINSQKTRGRNKLTFGDYGRRLIRGVDVIERRQDLGCSTKENISWS